MASIAGESGFEPGKLPSDPEVLTDSDDDNIRVSDSARSSSVAASARCLRCSPHLNHCALIGVHSCILRALCRTSMRAPVLIPEGVARDESEEPDPYTAVRPTLYGEPFLRSSNTVRGEFPGEDGGGALGAANMRPRWGFG